MRNMQEILSGTKYNENEIEYFLAECYLNFLYFAEHVLGFEIAEYHKDWYDYLEKFPRLCLIAFRGSGKTCFVSGYYIWKAIFKENLHFLIISNTFDTKITDIKNRDIDKYTLENILTYLWDNNWFKNMVDQEWKTKDGNWECDTNAFELIFNDVIEKDNMILDILDTFSDKELLERSAERQEDWWWEISV